MTQNSHVPDGSQAKPGKIGNAPLYAIGVVTPDLIATEAEYRRIFGVVPQNFGQTVTNEDPQGRKIGLAMSVVFFPDFYIKLQQPVGDVGPFSSHADKFGLSIMNFQIHVDDAQAVRARLEGLGGQWTLGSPDDFWAYINMRETLGVTLEPINTLNRFPIAPDPDVDLPLGSMPVTRVGIAVSDAEVAARNFAEAFQIPVPDVKDVSDFSCVSGGEEHPVRLRTASWKQGGIWIDLFESRSPSPWLEAVNKQGGDGAISVTFDVGPHLSAVMSDLEQKGGLVVCKNVEGTAAIVDFTSSLGLLLELRGESRGGQAICRGTFGWGAQSRLARLRRLSKLTARSE